MFNIFLKNQYLNVVYHIDDEDEVKLVHLNTREFDLNSLQDDIIADCAAIEIQVNGENQLRHKGNKFIGTQPGTRLKYVSHSIVSEHLGQVLKIVLTDKETDLEVHHFMELFNGMPLARTWNSVINRGRSVQTIDYLSSFTYKLLDKYDVEDWQYDINVSIPHNQWCGENQWRTSTVSELGLVHNNYQTSKKISVGSVGSWTTASYQPMVAIGHVETHETMLVQIEQSGSWNWEIGDFKDHLYLNTSGPNIVEGSYWRDLKPGQVETSPKTTVAMGDSIQHANKFMTQHRRNYINNLKMPFVFNDYFHCANGDTNRELELPLIDRAGDIGAEIFMIDASWYNAGNWWEHVGDWEVSLERFPNGMEEITELVEKRGMKLGLWLEIESAGAKSKIVKNAPDSWFLNRNGKRILTHERNQFDFSNQEVRDYLTNAVSSLVDKYRVAYFKIDYNINIGVGVDHEDGGFGLGLNEYYRHYHSWIEAMRVKYPEIIFEHCSSGGQRLDFELLRRHDLALITDQTDVIENAKIINNSSMNVLPEQTGVFAYPLENEPIELTIMNMVNLQLMRPNYSGPIHKISKEQDEIVKEGVNVFKKTRHLIDKGIPVWPLGIYHPLDDKLAYGLEFENKLLLKIYNFGEEQMVNIPLRNKIMNQSVLFPIHKDFEIETVDQSLKIKMKKNDSLFIEVEVI